MGKARGKKYCGDCIFCHSKCPECGSENVEVTFRPEYRYENTTHNAIRIHAGIFRAELECMECGNQSEADETAMEKLSASISRAIGIPHGYEVNITPRSNKLKAEPFYVQVDKVRREGGVKVGN